MPALDPVVGQEALKRKLVAAVSQYTAYRINPVVGRPLVLVAGPSGVGKTFSVQLLGEYTGLPYTEVAAASMAMTAHKGLTFRDLLVQHITQHHTDHGIIFVDEVDKWCKGAIGEEAETVALGKRMQAEALRMMTAETAVLADEMELEDGDTEEARTFRTSNVLWIIAGAFTGIDQLVRHRLHGHYNLSSADLWGELIHSDFIRYGMLTELVGRVQTIGWVKPLTVTEMIEILERQEVPAWEAMFKMIGCKLTVSPGALSTCADRAREEHTGVRGAQAFLRRGMEEIYSEASSLQLKTLIVDRISIETGRFDVDVEDVSA